MKHRVLFAIASLLFVASGRAADAPAQAYSGVLALRPAGFWPLDNRCETPLQDLSGNSNAASLFNVTWVDGSVEFTGGYEFIRIPKNKVYESPEFSLGLWVFVRRPGPGPNSNRRGVNVFGSRRHHNKHAIMLRLTGEDKLSVEVVSNSQEDAIGSLEQGIHIQSETWQHLLYTYKDGEGRLYIDGKSVCSKGGLEYTPMQDGLIAGPDSGWWAVHPPTSGALDGSMRGLVFFDRAIGETEAASVASTGQPEEMPHVLQPDELRLHGTFVKLGDLPGLDARDQRLALEFLCRTRYGWSGDLKANADILLPYLAGALKQPMLRYDAALLLNKMRDRDVLKAAQTDLLAIVQNEAADKANRATAALALSCMKGDAKDTIDPLVACLKAEAETGGVHVPRVEEAFRNALVTALLGIDPANTAARKVLGDVYAKPILDYLGMDKPYMKDVAEMAAEDRCMDALDACKAIIKEQKLYFRSQNNRWSDQREHWAGNSRAYTAMADYKGFTYKFGNGKAFDGATLITEADYDRAVEFFSETYPDAATWMDGKVDTMYRADLKKIAPDGSVVQTVYIGGENFIFTGRDIKTRGWSIGIDKNGYFHVMGGQHNFPRYSEFMPGTWQSIGLSHNKEDSNYPTILYWISKRPGDISEFEFVGLRDHPQDIPAPYMNYMNLVNDRNGELYLYGRNDKGIQNYAFYHYDADARRWEDLGGRRADIFVSARKAAPDWVHSVEQSNRYGYRGGIPNGKRKDEYPSICWGWEPHFYNYIRSTRGVQFDPENRMYVELLTYGYDGNRRMSQATMFAWSVDGGKTFSRADGTPVKPPFTNNPAPEHNADSTDGYNSIWIRQWKNLTHRIGFIF